MSDLIVVDDHPLVREGLKQVLKRSGSSINIIGEVSNAEELYDLLENSRPDLILLDISLPGKNGLEILNDLNQNHPDIPVLMLTMHPADRFAVRCLKSGASGYLIKSSIPNELETAIRVVLQEKRKYISPEVAEELAEQIDDYTGQPLHTLLSDREYQVMCMLAKGDKISEIAETLSLGVRTVHTYRSRLMEKLNLKSNVEIARYAISNNLIDQP
ncbi:MAG: response regulator transcription factor [Balneolaceae bacterium]